MHIFGNKLDVSKESDRADISSKFPFKEVLLSVGLALTSQVAQAKDLSQTESVKTLCPRGGPVNDSIDVIDAQTERTIHSRLMKLDREKHHQIAVVTVDNIEDYGFGSIEELANAIGRTCGIGYVGENTGVVLLYSKELDKFRTETAYTEKYIMDILAKRIGRNADEICESVSCKTNYITQELTDTIYKEFSTEESVNEIRKSEQQEKNARSQAELDDLLTTLGVVVVLIIGGGGAAGGGMYALNRRRRRKKHERLEVEYEFYMDLYDKTLKGLPSWFEPFELDKREQDKISKALKQNIPVETTDEFYDSTMQKILSLAELRDSYSTMVKQKEKDCKTKEQDYTTISGELKKLEAELDREDFIIPDFSPITIEGENPIEMTQSYKTGISKVNARIKDLLSSKDFYKNHSEYKNIFSTRYDRLLSDNNTKREEYTEIYGDYDVEDLLSKSFSQQDIDKLITDFGKVYDDKHFENIAVANDNLERYFSSMEKNTSDILTAINAFKDAKEGIKGIKTKVSDFDTSDIEGVSGRYAYKYFDLEGKKEKIQELLRGLDGLLEDFSINTVNENISEIKDIIVEISDAIESFNGLTGKIESIKRKVSSFDTSDIEGLSGRRAYQNFDLEGKKSHIQDLLSTLDQDLIEFNFTTIKSNISQINSVISDISRTIDKFNSYKSKISSIRSKESRFSYGSSYSLKQDERNYRNLSGDSSYRNFDVSREESNARSLVNELETYLHQFDFNKINSNIATIESILKQVAAYQLLGDKYDELLKEKIREEEEEKRRKDKEEEDRKRREADAAKQDDDDYFGGGGGGWSGGGATSD